MTVIKGVYRVIRSILFASIITIGALLILLYVILSVPGVQRKLCNEAETQLSHLLKAPVKIGGVNYSPFNELQLNEVEIRTPDNKPCISITKLGAGITLWKLILYREIEITYAELIELRAKLVQSQEKGPLNIQFIIDALASKDKQKPPTQFNLKLQNVVIRKSAISFDREWMPVSENKTLDVNHLEFYDVRADLAIPKLSNEEFEIDLRRLSFNERSGLYIDALSFMANISPKALWFKNVKLNLGSAQIAINNQHLNYNGYDNIIDALKREWLELDVNVRNLTAEDLLFLNKRIQNIPGKYNLALNLQGNLTNFEIENLNLISQDKKLDLSTRGKFKILSDKDISSEISGFKFFVDSQRINDILGIIPNLTDQVRDVVAATGFLNVNLVGGFDTYSSSAQAKGDISSSQGRIDVDGNVKWIQNPKRYAADIQLTTDRFNLESLFPNQPVGDIVADIDANISYGGSSWEDLNGIIVSDIPLISYNGKDLTNIHLKGEKSDKHIDFSFLSDSQFIEAQLEGACVLDKERSEWKVSGSLGNFAAAELNLFPKFPYNLSLDHIYVEGTGSNVDNMNGTVLLSGLNVRFPNQNLWSLDKFVLETKEDNGFRTIQVDSDILSGNVTGMFKFNDVKELATDILSYSLPNLIAPARSSLNQDTDFNFELQLNPNKTLYESFNINYVPLMPVDINGKVNMSVLEVALDAPYILKGKDKLIKNSHLSLIANREEGTIAKINTSWPTKKGYIDLDINSSVLSDDVSNNIGWKFDFNEDKGNVYLDLSINKNNRSDLSYLFKIKESEMTFNDTQWILSPATATLNDNALTVDNLQFKGGKQYINISGKASSNPLDTIRAELHDIDLSYIFNTLNINYVTFGGIATGNAYATNVFSKNPKATTSGLNVKNFSYNNAPLGNADLLGYWDNDHKSVGLGADIYDFDKAGERVERGKVNGEIFVTRDSLGINFDVNKINLALIQPFLSNVMQKVEGRATADLTLYGTFKDVNLVGKAFADTAAIKLGFTNVTYYGSDSVYFSKDAIRIPGFHVYDAYGNSALFSGEVRHQYFRDANIDFDIQHVKNLLAYNTDASFGDSWYGRIFASGSGKVWGVPGYTRLNFDVSTDPNSSFTFVLEETEIASEYNFLTFTDKRKSERTFITKETFEDEFKRKIAQSINTDEYSVLDMDLSVAINPGLKLNVIMDPSSGDKIEARGNGAMRLHYNTESDEVDIFGRYVLDEGNYLFRFQDLILRDFSIRPGSTISFNGDPMKGILNLAAAYRVNTNLSDLDKSFSSDRDLNRSSIPVDAVLKVSGELTSPDIDFDISMPTVTSEVERKVRSIISSEEMMQQQVLYLLALNRFYTPQFSGSSDGELISVASSTLSSQVANIFSQITDKVTLNPSFKSDRSDLSDMGVDLALSSQLFDNRLIINGNLGYRDRSVSQTNFIGDFDIEYLLSKDGRLRLKAYNHFNDAYYYLKSALTTQGVGLIYRKDFNDAFSFLRPKKRKKVVNKDEEK